MKKKCVGIIGGGPAGLSAAHELADNTDIDTIVFEKSTMVGGISRTESYNNYFFDIGGHRFFTKNETIRSLWNEILGEKFIQVQRISRIYYKGKFYHYPIRLVNTLVNLGPLESIRIIASYMAALVSPNGQEETFEDWVSNRFGKRLYRAFFKSYTEKVWGIPCRSIRADWASQRIQGLSLKTAVVNALVGMHASKTLIDEFDYPVLGPGMMWDGFKRAIEQQGGAVLMESRVESIRHDGKIITAVCYSKGSKRHEHDVDSLISSTPITTLIRILDPPPPDYVREAAGRLSYRSFLIVILIIREHNLFPDQWIYIHSPEVNVGRIQNFKNWSRALVPDPKKTSLGFEYFCNQGDRIWDMDDSELARMASEELEVLGLAEKSLVVDSHVVRQPHAYPVYDQGYQENVDIVRKYLAEFENLQTIGRSGMHRYNNMDHSMLTGIMAAKNLADASYNVWDVNEDDDYLEDGRREILDEYLDHSLAVIQKQAFGMASGITTGVFLFVATLFLVVKGGDVIGPNLSLLNQYLVGYSVSMSGAVLGFGYGLVGGFAGGWLFALLRNMMMIIQFNILRNKTNRIHFGDMLDYL